MQKIFQSVKALGGLLCSLSIICFLLIASCTKRECRGSITRPVLKIKFKKQFVSGGNVLYIKDTFLRITGMKGVGRDKDSLFFVRDTFSKDSFNIISLPLSPLYDTTSFIITWKDTNIKSKPNFISDRLKFSYSRYQVQTSELCGFQYYFNNLEAIPLPTILNGFQKIYVIKHKLDLVNDTVHAYVYLNQVGAK